MYWPTFQYEYEQFEVRVEAGSDCVALPFQCGVIPGNTVSSCARNVLRVRR